MNSITNDNAPLQLKDFVRDGADHHSSLDKNFKVITFNTKTNAVTSATSKSTLRKILCDITDTENSLYKATEDTAFLVVGFTSGQTINFLGALAYDSLVYGFDTGDNFTKYENISKPGENADENDSTIEIVPKDNNFSLPSFYPFTPLCNVALFEGKELTHLIGNFLVQFTDTKKFHSLIYTGNDKDELNKIVNVLKGDDGFEQSEEIYLIIPHDLAFTFKANAVEIQKSEIEMFTQDNVPMRFNRLVKMPNSSKSRHTGTQYYEFKPGKNILHFNSKNRDYELNENDSAQKLVERMKVDDAKEVKSDSEILRRCIEFYRKEINWGDKNEKKPAILEFGFCAGRSINFISNLLIGDEVVYGFDSGNGLPEDWRTSLNKETFRYKKQINFLNKHINFSKRDIDTTPPLIPFIPARNVHLVVGLIKDTLPNFLRTDTAKNFYFPLIFIDTDLYSSAKTILEELGDCITPNKTIIVLDEGYNFKSDGGGEDNDWMNHEFKAIQDFGTNNGYIIKYIAYNGNGQQLALIYT